MIERVVKSPLTDFCRAACNADAV